VSQFPWPGNSRVAVCLTWDVDGESAHYARAPERARNQLSELHQRAYGPRRGIWKVLSLLRKHSIPGTFYVPAYTAGIYPDVMKAIVECGHPIGLHGYMHETLDTLDKCAEEEVLVRAKTILTRVAGYEPTLYRAPSCELNRWTPELLVRHGILSDASLMDDDVPYALETNAGPLVEVPFQWLLDDYPFWGFSRLNRDKSIADPEAVFNIWKHEFDGAYGSGGCFVLTLHPFISGRWTCLYALECLIEYAKMRPDVWWTTVADVTQHARTLLEEGRLERRSSPPPEPVRFSL